MQIYGKESQFDAARLVDLLGAYESFKVASTSARGSMSSTEVLDAGSPTALPAGTMPGRYEPQGAAWPRVWTADVYFHKLGQSAMLIAPLDGPSSISPPVHSAPCAFISCHAKCQDHVGLASNHGALDACLQLHPVAVQGQHNGRTPQHAPVEHQASTSFPLAGFPLAPFMEVLPAPALGLLTSALAVPGIVLGSILETNALPDFGSSPSVPSGEHVQPSSVTSGEYEVPIPIGCGMAYHP